MEVVYVVNVGNYYPFLGLPWRKWTSILFISERSFTSTFNEMLDSENPMKVKHFYFGNVT